MSEAVKLLLMSDRVLRRGARVNYAALNDGNTATAIALNENISDSVIDIENATADNSAASPSTSVIVADHADHQNTQMTVDIRVSQLAAELYFSKLEK